jgi:hypothetical protein
MCFVKELWISLEHIYSTELHEKNMLSRRDGFLELVLVLNNLTKNSNIEY